jgi:ankyrin repeat protein
MNRQLRMHATGALLTLLLMGASWSPPEVPVADAAQRGDVEAVRSLLRQGADVNAAQGDGMTALHWAAQNGNVALIDMLVYAGAHLEATTRLGDYRPLHLASRAGQSEAISSLLEAGAEVDAAASTGVTSLHYAAAAGRADAVEALLAHGASVDRPAGDDELTPLMWAAAANRVASVRTLLKAGADVSLTSRVVEYASLAAEDRPARQRRNALLEARRAVERGESAPAADRPAPPTTRPSAPAPAVSEEPPASEEAAEETPDSTDASAPEEAEPPAQQQAEPAAPAPRARGASPQGAPGSPAGAEPEEQPLSYDQLVGREGGFTALHFAARAGLEEVARVLLDEGGADLDQGTAGDGTSPLLMAVINGNFDMAMDFLGRGADPNQVAEDGAAPLFTVLNRRWGPKAAYPQPQMFTQQDTDYLVLLEALLEAGADVDHRTGRHIWYTSFNFDMLGVQFAGATAFWRAAYATDVAAMKLLMSYGADPNIPTRKVPTRRFVFDPTAEPPPDKSGLPEVAVGGPAVYPIHAASGVGYGEGFAANQHSHAPDSWLPAVRYLVEELGADVNARDLNGYSPLHHAAARGDNELILYLVERGADVTVVSRQGETTVDMANGPRQRVQPFPETIALLEGLGAKNNHNCQSC